MTATARSSRRSTPWAAITTTTYDNRGWVATETDRLGNVVTYSYTATGMASTVTDPNHSGGGQQDFTYDKDDRLIDETDANGNTTSLRLRRGGQPDQRDRC